jgi:NADH-quinone oxidoreductase subunit K
MYIILFYMSLVLFFIGLLGLVIQNNLLMILLSLELIIISCGLNFIFISKSFNHFSGQIYALLLFAVSACETAIGLGLLVKLYLLNYNYPNSLNILYYNKFRY